MPERSNSSVKLGIGVLIVIVLTLVSSLVFAGPFIPKKEVLGLKNPGFELISNFQFTFDRSQNKSPLAKIMDANLADKPGTYGIFIQSLTGEEKYFYNEKQQFPAASLYKLFLIAAVVNEIEQGNISLDTKVSASKQHLEEVFGGVDFGYENKSGTITYTVKIALERVGRISDNFAAIMLTEKIGRVKLQQIATQIGATNTVIQSPITTTPEDIALFFQKLYTGQILSPKVSEQIIHFLSLNQLNNRIPAKLPKDIKIVHKTGELSRVRHDAGIVYCCSLEEEKPAEQETKNYPYVIVLMSKDLKDENEGIEFLAQISEEVYRYFNQKQTD